MCMRQGVEAGSLRLSHCAAPHDVREVINIRNDEAATAVVCVRLERGESMSPSTPQDCAKALGIPSDEYPRGARVSIFRTSKEIRRADASAIGFLTFEIIIPLFPRVSIGI